MVEAILTRNINVVIITWTNDSRITSFSYNERFNLRKSLFFFFVKIIIC